jgi:hypothetical protein
MNRIINSLAEAEFNKKINAVEVNFRGTGPAALYHETMDIAMNISLIYHTNQWLLRKKHFEDITPDAFLKFVVKWSEKSHLLFLEHAAAEHCKVALLTTVDCCLYLMAEYAWLSGSGKNYPNLEMQLFSSMDEAKSFLGQGKEPKLIH